MMAFIMGVLHLIPGFTSLAQSVVTTIYNSKVAMYQARWGVTQAVAVAAIQAEATNNQAKVGWLMAIASNPVLLFIVFGFAAPFIIYEWQAVVIDKVINHGTTRTDAITGPIADWAQIILSGIFLTSTGIGVAHTIINKKD